MWNGKSSTVQNHSHFCTNMIHYFVLLGKGKKLHYYYLHPVENKSYIFFFSFSWHLRLGVSDYCRAQAGCLLCLLNVRVPHYCSWLLGLALLCWAVMKVLTLLCFLWLHPKCRKWRRAFRGLLPVETKVCVPYVICIAMREHADWLPAQPIWPPLSVWVEVMSSFLCLVWLKSSGYCLKVLS